MNIKTILTNSGLKFAQRKLGTLDRNCWVARLNTSSEAISMAKELAPEVEACGASVYAGRSAPVVGITREMLHSYAEGGKPLPKSESWRELVVVPQLTMPEALVLLEVEGFPDSMRASAANQRVQILKEIKNLVTQVHSTVDHPRLISVDSSFAMFEFRDEVSVKVRQLIVDLALDINARYFPSGPSPRATGKHWVKSKVFGFGPT